MCLADKEVFFADFVFRVPKTVYEPAEDSFLFAENLVVRKGDTVLDMGTGCGILGIITAEKATRVVAADLNPYAVRCAKENAKLNDVTGGMFFLQGDLFAPLRMEEKFDLILFNAPYVPTEPTEEVSWLSRAWTGGVTGRQVIDRFIDGAHKHLRKTGQLLLMQSTLCDVDKTLKRFEGKSLKANVVAEHVLPFFESIVLIRARIDSLCGSTKCLL